MNKNTLPVGLKRILQSKIPQMEITYQPLNKMYGALLKLGNHTIFNVNAIRIEAKRETLREYNKIINS